MIGAWSTSPHCGAESFDLINNNEEFYKRHAHTTWLALPRLILYCRIQIHYQGEEHRETCNDWKYQENRKCSICTNGRPDKNWYQERPKYASQSVLSPATMPHEWAQSRPVNTYKCSCPYQNVFAESSRYEDWTGRSSEWARRTTYLNRSFD